MKNRDLIGEGFYDVKNVDDIPWLPGQYVPFDMALFYPGGKPL